MKKCTKCKFTKDKSRFHKHPDKKDGLQSWCKNCQKGKMSDNKERYYNNKRIARYRKLGIELSVAQLEAKHCAICGTVAKLHVDHCHKTNRFRGLLCTQCNVLLGMAHENTTTLQKAIDYLSHE